MIIDVARHIALKKFEGSFNFGYDCPADLTLLPSAVIEGQVQVEGTFEIYEDDSVGVSLKLSYLLCGPCSYCLEPVRQRVEYVADVLFVTKDDGENYSYNGYKINLTAAVNDAVIFSQPHVLLCGDDCGGIDLNNSKREV